MRTVFLGQFLRDLEKIKEKKMKSRVEEIIQQVENADVSGDIKNLKKLKGHSIAYRIKVGSYRIGLFIEPNHDKILPHTQMTIISQQFKNTCVGYCW